MSNPTDETKVAADPETGLRCLAIWLRSVGFNAQADDCEAYMTAFVDKNNELSSKVAELQDSITARDMW